MTDATVTLTGPDNLIRHIEGLQATLTKRNATIEQLRAEVNVLRGAEPFVPTQEDLRQAFLNGYNAALRRLGGSIQDAQSVASTLADGLRKAYGEVAAEEYHALREEIEREDS